MKVLIFDRCFSARGHRIPYASLVAEAFTDDDVVMALPTQMQGEPILSDYFSDRIELLFFKTQQESHGIARIREAWRCLREQIKRCRPDVVAIPTGDGLAFWGGVRNLVGLAGTGGVPIDICLMRGHFRSQSDSLIKKTISNLKWWIVSKGPWRRILLVDPRSFDELKDPTSSGVELCPDPAPPQKFSDQAEARAALDLPETGRIIISVGNQEIRKGTDLLLLAFEQAQLETDDYLVLIGRFDTSIKLLAEKIMLSESVGHRLVIRDCFVSDDELQQAVIASDLVAIPYRDVERPSGIITRAVAWKRPLIGTNRGWIKWFLEKYEAGFPTLPENTDSFAKDLQHALSSCDQIISNNVADEFRSFNTKANYLKTWNSQTGNIKQKLID